MRIGSFNPVERQPEEVPRSLEALFDRYHLAVLALFRRRGFAEGECEDLAQETFLKAHRSLPAYRGEAPIEHWLFRIASNTAKASLRSRSAARRAAVEMSLEDVVVIHREGSAAHEDPLRSLLSSECSKRLLTAVDRLPPRMRCCVQLFLEQDLRYREIAEVLRISEQTVKVQLLRARGYLRERLNEDADERCENEEAQ